MLRQWAASRWHVVRDGAVVPTWTGRTHQDLHREYRNVFKYGNRNAASHLWSAFLLDRAPGMTHEQLVHIFQGFCAVSGSPVNPHDYSRYRLRLDNVLGGKEVGYFQYCCWPCVCDTQDFIRIDTRNVTTSDGTRQYRFAVIGNPCDHREKLDERFEQSFGWGDTSIKESAPEVRCSDDGQLLGAYMSDNGYVILTMFFDDGEGGAVNEATALAAPNGKPTPGRVLKSTTGLTFQDEFEFQDMCESRKNAGYNSGMGEIFRKVAGLSPIVVRERLPAGGVTSEALTTEANASEL